MKRIAGFTGGIILFCGLIFGIFYLDSLMPVITGYAAKHLCSSIFISGRNQLAVEALDLNFSLIRYTRNEVDYTKKTVTSRFLWGKSTAIYRDGFGAVLVRESDQLNLTGWKFPAIPPLNYLPDTVLWPLGKRIPDAGFGMENSRVIQIAKDLVEKKAYGGHAFAFLALHQGVPAAEFYDAGFNQKTRFLSWSIAKSFTNALAGIMVKDNIIRLDQNSLVPEWQADGRKEITLNDLLQMQSGLEWNEDYGNRSDVTMMLYDQAGFAEYAINKKLICKPGDQWNYSSGTANIVQYILRHKFPDDAAYYTFTQERLFRKIGIYDAVFETDPTGTLAGSSYLYATARDYGRFGLLYLNDGVFNGERVLPEGWVKYTSTPAKQSKYAYGALFWLNKNRYYPDAPTDMICCNGHDGQRIFIIPSEELVVVILGYSPKSSNAMDFNRLLKDIIGAVHQPTL